MGEFVPTALESHGGLFLPCAWSMVDRRLFVGNQPLWVSQLNQLSLPSSVVGKWVAIHLITWIMEMETIKTAD